MADRVHPYLFYDTAISICSTWYRRAEGKIVPIAVTMMKNSKYFGIPVVMWGILQWIALVPLIARERAIGHPKTVQGLFLSSACASMMLVRAIFISR
jgi:hypothetical protein